MHSRFSLRLAAATMVLSALPVVSSALTFNFDHRADLDAAVVQDFQTAANYWSSRFSDPVTVNIHIDYQAFGPGFLGFASSNQQNNSYHDVKNALNGDKTSGADFTAVNHLQGGDNLSFLINHTSQNGDSAATYLDNNASFNNQNMSISTANAKALGLRAANDGAQDADIEFNSSFNDATHKFIFNRTGTYGPQDVDFTSVCLHEIGHAMGFFSGVDGVDEADGQTEDNYLSNTLDLFRLSQNQAGGFDMDMSADTREKLFSIDGGATIDGAFSKGVVFGDGWQASHWKHFEDYPSRIGIMDPRAFRGGNSFVKDPDIEALDVIGWNAVPEPTTMVGLAMGAMALLRRRRKN